MNMKNVKISTTEEVLAAIVGNKEFVKKLEDQGYIVAYSQNTNRKEVYKINSEDDVRNVGFIHNDILIRYGE